MIKRLLPTLISAVCLCMVSSLSHAQYTPGGLFSLARAGNIKELEKLLEQDPHIFLLNGALEAAVVGGQIEAISLLYKHGADLDYVNPQGSAVLVSAIMLERYEAARHLLELGADPDIIGYHRVYQGYTMDWKWTPMMAASYQGSLKTAELLIKKGAKINKPGYSVSLEEKETAADIAAYSGRLDILKLLLKHDGMLADSAIFKATRGGHLDVVRFLLNEGYDVNAVMGPRQKTLLMEAAWWGHLDLVDYLIKVGANVNAADINGYTALSDAADNGGAEFPDQLAIVKLLVANGADVRKAGDFKLTPLMRAQNPDVIEFLIEAGAR